MEHIRTDLAKRLNQRSLAITATAAYICHVANQQANGRYTAVSFRNGTLTLAAPTAGAAQNLRLSQSALTTTLQQVTNQPNLRLRLIVRSSQD